VARVDRFDDHPPPWFRSAAFAFRLSASAIGGVVNEVEDPAAAGDLILPPLQRLALVDTVPMVLPSSLRRREENWVGSVASWS
jgi:hypothetical protein